MNDAQRIMLFRLFSDACKAAGIIGGIARDQYREQLTIKVCGELISWNDFNNQQIDDMKAELLAILRPADLDAQLTQIDMPRRRMTFAIGQRANTGYVEKLCRDRFGHTDLARLSMEQLRQLRVTIENRSRSKAKKAEEPF